MMTTKNTIMAKNKKSNSSDDSQEERLVKSEDMVEFISNGTSKHLGKDGDKFQVHRFHGETLAKKGYGEIGEDLEVTKPNTGRPIEGMKM